MAESIAKSNSEPKLAGKISSEVARLTEAKGKFYSKEGDTPIDPNDPSCSNNLIKEMIEAELEFYQRLKKWYEDENGD